MNFVSMRNATICFNCKVVVECHCPCNSAAQIPLTKYVADIVETATLIKEPSLEEQTIQRVADFITFGTAGSILKWSRQRKSHTA